MISSVHATLELPRLQEVLAVARAEILTRPWYLRPMRGGMPFSNDARNSMLDDFALDYDFVSLHTAYSSTGASEVTGGSPAYARKAITWNAAASGSLDNSNTQVFDVPAGTTIRFYGFWTDVAAGTFGGMFPLQDTAGARIPFTAEDTTDVLTADGHGYSDTQSVVVWDTTGAVIPTGLVEGTVYFVRDATTDTFKLAATSGGAAIDLTTDGAGFVQKITPETFGGQGTHTLTDADVDLLG